MICIIDNGQECQDDHSIVFIDCRYFTVAEVKELVKAKNKSSSYSNYYLIGYSSSVKWVKGGPDMDLSKWVHPTDVFRDGKLLVKPALLQKLAKRWKSKDMPTMKQMPELGWALAATK